jgi:hypothetical protein
VDVLVGRAVDIEDVGAPLTGSGEPGLNLDVIIAGSPDRIHSHRLDQFIFLIIYYFEKWKVILNQKLKAR